MGLTMWVGKVPHALKILTLAERILVSRYISAAYVVKLHPKKASGPIPGNQLSSGLTGNVSTFKLDTQGIAGLMVDGQLPFHPRVLAATILVTFVGAHNMPMHVLRPLASVNRERVAAALRWLIANSPISADIEVSDENLALLPEDGMPVEVLANVKWSDNTSVLNQERAGYVPNDIDSECEEESWEPDIHDCESEEEDASNQEDDTPSAVFPILTHGVVNVEGNNIPRSELLAHAFQNMTTAGTQLHLVEPNMRFNVRHGDFVNEYGRRDEAERLTTGPPGNPNHLLGCYPHLFPYGRGGYETERKVIMSYEAHAKWSL
ncbi:hypothetical protein C8J55DRAFT_562532 [Lentinula edodes]|uniref:DUF6570 domain-containing protein n=1 Tax=Lentinula lateritia TaxID=40482 RepID=A0A9W9DLK6_9AGAR|nr:hypothetical protein C8J55DRAFT_562532 [Lentinula edodes]